MTCFPALYISLIKNSNLITKIQNRLSQSWFLHRKQEAFLLNFSFLVVQLFLRTKIRFFNVFAVNSRNFLAKFVCFFGEAFSEKPSSGFIIEDLNENDEEAWGGDVGGQGAPVGQSLR